MARSIQSFTIKRNVTTFCFSYVWVTQMALISLLIIVTYFAMRREKLSSFKVWSIPIVLFIGILVMKAFNSHAYGLKFKDIAVVMDFYIYSQLHYGLVVYRLLFFCYVKRITNGICIGI